jgi:hypothetical protein
MRSLAILSFSYPVYSFLTSSSLQHGWLDKAAYIYQSSRLSLTAAWDPHSTRETLKVMHDKGSANRVDYT